MSKASDFDIPEEALFTETHEYVLVDGDQARVGISHHAAEQLGDVVYVELPEMGEKFDQSEPFGSIESVKAASDLYMPVDGEVLAINPRLEEEPELVNDSCYGAGWMLEIELTDTSQLDKLMSPEDYIKFLEEVTA